MTVHFQWGTGENKTLCGLKQEEVDNELGMTKCLTNCDHCHSREANCPACLRYAREIYENLLETFGSEK